MMKKLGNLLEPGTYIMATRKAATKKKAAKKSKAERKPIDVSEIEVGQGYELPPRLRDSKYPWQTLADGTLYPDKNFTYFSIPFEDKAEAEQARSSIYASGRQFFLKRKLEMIPIVRVVVNEDDEAFIICTAKMEEQED